MNLPELFETWRAWNERSVLDTALRRAEQAGEQERAAQLRELLADRPRVLAVDALAAQHELTELLSGWRWHTVTAAREEGATWDDIAAATRADPDQARESYRERVAEAQQAAAELHLPLRDADRYRAAAGEDTDTTTAEPVNRPEGDQAMPDHDDYDRQPEMIAGPDLDDQGFVVGEIALPGGLPPDEDEDADEVARWDEALSIADRDGYVMFDPTASGGFRALSADEYRTFLDPARAGMSSKVVQDDETAVVKEPGDEGQAEHLDDLGQQLDDVRVRLTGHTWREGVDRDEALANRRQQLGYWYALDGDDQGAEQGLDNADGADGPDPRWYR